MFGCLFEKLVCVLGHRELLEGQGAWWSEDLNRGLCDWIFPSSPVKHRSHRPGAASVLGGEPWSEVGWDGQGKLGRVRAIWFECDVGDDF